MEFDSSKLELTKPQPSTEDISLNFSGKCK